MGSRWRASKAQQSLDLMAQELGILLLIKRGERLLTANGDDLCDTSDPSRVIMRQIAGAFTQYEKARLVARLRRAREVKGKMGGRKSLMETRPEVVELARKLRRSRSGKQRSLREISAELAARGFVAERTGRSYEAAQVSRMLAQRTRGAPARKGREVLQDLTQSGDLR
jgi:DNA invertase Pin-like site-specific DNA recombinase